MIIQGKWTLSDKGRLAVLEGRLEDAQKEREGLLSKIRQYEVEPEVLDMPDDELWMLSELDELDKKINLLKHDFAVMTVF